jgi:hypothetical protein
MFKTNALSSIKSILPTINQPLPLTRQESQKLLNVLKTSFRKNLDEEHNPLPENVRPSPTASLRPTDRHLHAILSNPLFSHDKDKSHATAPISRDPMDTFDRAVAKGMMTIPAAVGCLRAKRLQIIQSSVPSVREAMAVSRAGLRVAQWLRSSGHERTLEFIANKELVIELVRFMMAEDMEELAWMWVAQLMEGSGSGNTHKLAGFLMYCLVAEKGSTVHGNNLDPALATILRADDMYHSNPGFTQSIAGAWRKATTMLTLGAWARPPPSEALFNSFLGTAHHIQRPLTVELPHLDLYHPTRPSPEKAIRFFQEENLWRPYAKPNLTFDNEPPQSMGRVVAMGLDTVKYLTGSGQKDQAQWILELLQSNFARELRLRRPLEGGGRLQVG